MVPNQLPRTAWSVQPEQSAAMFEARNPGTLCQWQPGERVFRVQVHRNGRVHGPLTSDDLNYLEAVIGGRVPGVHMNTAVPPDQLDAAHTRQLANLIRDYLHLRDQRTAA